MARKKEKRAGEHGTDTCWCGECHCETQEECLDPKNADCICKGSSSHCCGSPAGDGPEVVEVQEVRTQELVPV